jgi:hypothetical protein
MVDWVVLGACGPGVLPESLPAAGICIKSVMLIPNRLTMLLTGIYSNLNFLLQNDFWICDFETLCLKAHSNVGGTLLQNAVVHGR